MRELVSDLDRELAEAGARLEETRSQLTPGKEELRILHEEVRKYRDAWAIKKTQLETTERSLREQKELVDKAKSELSTSFKAIAAQALQTNNAGFLTLAEQKFQTLRTESTSELDARKKAIETLVKPVSDSLAAYQKVTTELEEKRQKEMGSIGEQLRAVASTQDLLRSETNRLVTALKSPQVRGRWGEVTLRRTAELAGMSAYCDFFEQVSVTTEDGYLRPDMLVKLPAGRDIVVDSKVPLMKFIEALESQTEEQRTCCLDEYAKHVMGHVDRLAAKEYWGQFPSAPEFVVLFIPSDSFLAAAAEKNPNLVEAALNKKIVLATPTTLVALLRAIEYGWRQQIAVDNALHIRDLGQDLSDRFAVFAEHLTKMLKALGRASEAYNAAVGSFESRILPAARRFKELGAGGSYEIEELEPLDLPLRTVSELNGEGQPEDQSD